MSRMCSVKGQSASIWSHRVGTAPGVSETESGPRPRRLLELGLRSGMLWAAPGSSLSWLCGTHSPDQRPPVQEGRRGCAVSWCLKTTPRAVTAACSWLKRTRDCLLGESRVLVIPPLSEFSAEQVVSDSCSSPHTLRLLIAVISFQVLWLLSVQFQVSGVEPAFPRHLGLNWTHKCPLVSTLCITPPRVITCTNEGLALLLS